MTAVSRLFGRRVRVAASLLFAALPCLLIAEDAQVLERLKQDLQTISSDEYEGRGIGTRGLEMAADYVLKGFERAGLKLDAVDGGAFQSFEVLDKVELGSPNELVLTGPDGKRIEAMLDKGFRPMSISGSGETSAPLVFAGYGIESKDPVFDEFEGLDVHGKTVIMLRRTPQQDRNDGLFGGPHSRSGRMAALKTKLSNAQRRGAAAVIFVNDAYTGESELNGLKEKLAKAKDDVALAAEPFAKESDRPLTEARKRLGETLDHLNQLKQQIAAYDDDPLVKFGSSGTPSAGALPVFQVKRAIVHEVLSSATGKSLAAIEKEIDETGKPASVAIPGWTADITANVVSKMAAVKNVIGVLPGKGDLADETVVVGAHYDHLGRGDSGSLQVGSTDIHNGADDNASGTAALLEIARSLKRFDAPSRRRIVFIAFTGEERGLLGSAEYVRNPVFPLESTVAMINLDMVGRLKDDKLTVFGTDTAKEWNALLDGAAGNYRLNIIKKPEGFGPSDHSSFYAKQIPVLHLFTGTHAEYHRPNDDWPLINFEGMQRVTRLAEDLVKWAAVTTPKPTYVQVSGRAQIGREGSRPYFGSIPDFGTNEKGYAIQGVGAGSPADQAGLKAGDIIMKLGDQAIAGLEDFDLALRKYSAGQQIDVVVKRGGMEVTLKVTLGVPRE